MTKQANRARDDGAENGASSMHFRSPVITACLVVIALCIGGYAFSYLKSVLSPLLIALFIFFLTNPIVRYFQARNYSPTFSYFLVLMITIVAFSGLGRIFYGSVQEFSSQIEKYGQNLDGVVEHVSRPVIHTLEYFNIVPKPEPAPESEKDKEKESSASKPEGAKEATPKEESTTESEKPQTQNPETESPDEAIPSNSKEVQLVIDALNQLLQKLQPSKTIEIKPVEQSEKDRLVAMLRDFFREGSQELLNGVIGTSLEFLEIAVMTIFYLFFILIEAHKLPQRIKRGFAYESTQTLMEMGIKIQRSIEQYLRVKTGVSFGLGATTGLIGLIFGLDFWLLWAGFMFLSNYVTYIGSMVALVPPIAIAFLQFSPSSNEGTLTGAIVMSVLMVANRFFWIDYVEIKLSGHQLNVSPVILLLSIGLFGALWGVIGMVLAVPVVTSVKIALAQFDSTAHLASLLSED